MTHSETKTISAGYTPVKILLISVWFALLSGFAEASMLAGAKFLLQRYLLKSPHVFWMAPANNLLIFGILGIILFLIALGWPRFISLWTTTLIFAFLGVLSLLLMVPSLGGYAVLAMAAGVAVQTARFIRKHEVGFLQLAYRSSIWMVILFVALVIIPFGHQMITERRAMANLPPPPKAAPNVLLIVLDTVRAQNMSMYGYERKTTPNLDRFAESGVRFNMAISTAPWTLPSHASMFTGRYHHELSVDWRKPLDRTYPTLAEALSSRGYVTAGFVANTLYCDSASGLSRGFAHYEDYVVSPGELIKSSSLGKLVSENQWLRGKINNHQVLGRKSAPQVNEAFLSWLSSKDERPFFAFLNYLDAHEPYIPPEPFDLKFGSKRPANPELDDEYKYSPEEIQELIDAYDGSISYLDHQLGLLFEQLESRGLLTNTLVIVTSDHGEEFGEHGVMSHSNSLYLPSVHVPLVISFPTKVPSGKRFDGPVSLRDLPATVVALLGLEKDLANFPGKSLMRYWDGAHGAETEPLLSEVNQVPNVPEWFPIAKGDMKSMILGATHYIRNGDGSEELYDLELDPTEKRNLAASADGRQAIQQFRTSLEKYLLAPMQGSTVPKDHFITLRR